MSLAFSPSCTSVQSIRAKFGLFVKIATSDGNPNPYQAFFIKPKKTFLRAARYGSTFAGLEACRAHIFITRILKKASLFRITRPSLF